MDTNANARARLARGWDDAAAGYEAYFVPRFAPWVRAAVLALTPAVLPDGPILVPCCGTFPELDTLIGRLPDRQIVGIDLSAGMVRLATERAAGRSNVSVLVGDASTLDAAWSGRCAAVVSVFGLQQLPEPERALRAWTAALRPSGQLSIVYWPEHTEASGPFTLIAETVRAVVPADAAAAWDGRLVQTMTAAGATVERDETLSYPITHPDAATFFDAYTQSGPLRTLANARGPGFVAAIRAEFLRRTPAGQWTHHPHARLIVARA